MWKEVLVFSAIFSGSRFFLMWILQYLADHVRKSQRINTEKVHPKQIEREGMWPLGLLMDTLLFGALAFWGYLPLSLSGPFWGCLLVLVLSHIVLVEPIYYAYHRLLHVSWFYKHHHIYHHKSIRTEPITSMSFTLSERFSYTLLFAVPTVVAIALGIVSLPAIFVYYFLFDLFNSLGHLNIRLETEGYKKSKVLKWLFYSPEYHEKHHSLFTTNYALFMPIWDKLFGTETIEHL